MSAADIEIVRAALRRFIARANGCADTQCGVCSENKRVAAEAYAALDRLEGKSS